VNPASYTFGNAPRPVLRGSGLAAADLTLGRRVALTEQVKAELRVEAYILPNGTNDNRPGFTLGAADFGVTPSARLAPTVQLGTRLTF
jgi:hypothetical protein